MNEIEMVKILLLFAGIYLILICLTVLYCTLELPKILNTDSDIPMKDIINIQTRLNEVLDPDIKIEVTGEINEITYDAILIFRFRYESDSEYYSQYDKALVDYVFGDYVKYFNF